MVVDGKTLVLNGLGLREATIFNVDVFVAALYVEQKSKSANVLLSTEQRVQVVLHFVRETSAETIADELDAGLAANAPAASPKDKRTLRGWIADVGVGDSMVFTYVPGRGLELRVKGRVQGTFSGTAFARAVLSVLIVRIRPTKACAPAYLAVAADSSTRAHGDRGVVVWQWAQEAISSP